MTKTTTAREPRRSRQPRAAGNGQSRPVPLRSQTEEALSAYFGTLNGHKPGRLYELVLREVEMPLFKSVMDYVEGNQSRAADILGINRGTLRKKLREYGLSQ
jgi:Fis family transcriptional regulator